ncbi:hypothetical protein N7488_006276 [Penicillium malachiteum]|nr:hypothetical protein N7488_006276 [Penicillium malachiteum]
MKFLAMDPNLSVDARTFLLSKVLDLNIPHDELGILERGHYFPTQETILSLLNHDDLETRTRGVYLSIYHKNLDVTVLQRLLTLSEFQYPAAKANSFRATYQYIAAALINQQSLPSSILQQALDFCHRENFARNIRLLPSCTILVRNSFLQKKDYEALLSKGSWKQCLYTCEDLLPGLLLRFKDKVLAELSCKDSFVVSLVLSSIRYLKLNNLAEPVVDFLVTTINHGTFDHAIMAVDVLPGTDFPANTARRLAPSIQNLRVPGLFKVLQSS